MESNNQYQKYRDISVNTSTPGERVILLYDEAILQINRAILHIKKKEPGFAHENIIKAEKIFLYLIDILDLRYPISQDLLKFYRFIYLQLIEANAYKDGDKLLKILTYVKELKDTWQQIEIEMRQKNEGQRDFI